MARGTPDYGQYQYPTALSEPTNDNVIAMQYGFAPMDTRGRIIIFDIFRFGHMAWGLLNIGGGANPIIENFNLHSFASPINVVLRPTVNGGRSEINRNIRVASSTKLGIEGAFWCGVGSGTAELSLNYVRSDGHNITSGCRFKAETGKFQYYNQNSVWTDLSSPVIETGSDVSWIPFKYVIDVTTAKYDRFVFGHETTDISTLLCRDTTGSTQFYRLGILGGSDGSAANFGDVFLGYIIVTRDEP